jgi:hypothetical protein
MSGKKKKKVDVLNLGIPSRFSQFGLFLVPYPETLPITQNQGMGEERGVQVGTKRLRLSG